MEPSLSESRLNDAYVALRNLLRAKFVSAGTKERVARAVEQLNKEAFVDTVIKKNIDDEAA